MREFCAEVKADAEYNNRLIGIFNDQKNWYIAFHKKYSNTLCTMLDKWFAGESSENGHDIMEAKTVIEQPSAIAEPLAKLVMSLYCKGPTNKLNWIVFNINFSTMLDILQQRLRKENEGSHLALGVLLETRLDRNNSDHKCEIVENPSTIRMMNIIRDMLVFIDPNLEGKLPTFSYPKTTLDIQSFFSDDKFNPKARKLILVAGSLHDIPLHQRELLANLPWTMVIDLDAASDFGGLLSSVNDKSRLNIVCWNKVASVSARRDFNSGITEWYTCGDFLDITQYDNHLDKPDDCINGYITERNRLITTDNKKPQIERGITELFNTSFMSLKDSPYPVTIVYMYNSLLFAKRFIATIDTKLSEAYSFLGVYYQKKNDILSVADIISAYYPDDDLERFNFYCCDLNSFFSTLEQYKKELPLLKTSNIKKTLPSKDGPKEIAQNRMQTLSKYFDVLYNGCDCCDQEQAEINNNEFYKGKQAAWSVFASYNAPVFLFEREREYYIDCIEKLLDRAEQNNKVIIYHKPGIGGTTFVRSLCHSLHKTWPVVCAKKGYSPEMANELIALYDDLKKGIIVLADEMEISEIESLSKKLWESQSRPFCIVASRRITTGTKQHMLNTLSDDECAKLIAMYSRMSPPDVDSKGKLANIGNDLPAENMVPLIIALYFLEKDFNGVKDYVSKTLQFCQTNQEKKTIAYTALLNIYNQFAHLPNDFAVYLTCSTVNPKLRYLKEKSYARSVLLDESNNCIKTKHYLISEEILKQVAIQLYGMSPDSNFRTYLHSFAMDFIDDYFRFLTQYGCRYRDTDNDILKGLFIAKDSNDDSKFSKLIVDISLNENSERVLKRIVAVSESFAEDCINEDDRIRLYNAIAHFSGHLGRFYRSEENIRKNYEASLECAKKSIEPMETGNGNDAFIYHMCGEAYRKYIESKTYYLRCSDFSYDEFCEQAKAIEELFSMGNKMYDLVIECGQLQHGYLSQLEMYLQFVGDMYYEDGENKRWSLASEKEKIYICDINYLIDSLYDLELDEASEKKRDELVHKFRSGFYRHEDSISYYNGMVDSARSANNQELLAVYRFGLLHARLRAWNENSGEKNASETIMELLDDICSRTNVSADPHENRLMAFACEKWLYFARLNSKPIQDGIVIAELWKTLCEKMRFNTPKPYYNLYVLEYLNMFDGFSSSNQRAEDYRRKCYEKAERSGGAFGKIDTVRDLLIQGRGMGRLYPRIGKSSEPDAARLVRIEGSVERYKAKKGYIKISVPSQWNFLEAKFSLNNKISLKEDFYPKVAFYGAFTYEQIVANSNIVADISTGESLEKMFASIKEDAPAIDRSSIRKEAAPEMKRNVPIFNVNDAEKAVFYPNWCFRTDDGRIFLNGSPDNNEEAGFELSELGNLDGCPDDVEDAAKEIIRRKADCGLPIMCRKKMNGKYQILICQSFTSFAELMGADENVAHGQVPDTKQNSPKPAAEAKVDYSFLKGAEVLFIFKDYKKDRITGSFEYGGKKYSGILKCDSNKACQELFKKGCAKARVYSPSSNSMLKPL